MRIDAHQHFWTLSQFPHPWITEKLQPLRHNFGPADLQPLLQRHRLDGSVLVQTFSSLEETRWFLTLASTHDFIKGVVGWVDLTDPDVGEMVEGLRDHPKLVGIRHVVHDESDVRWLERPDVLRCLGELASRGIPYDLLIKPPHLASAVAVARRFPSLPLVVDHIAKPRIAQQGREDWDAGIAELAACPNVHCKLSGMITEADWKSWKPSDLKPYVNRVIDLFTPQRLMFGTDWPVCLLAGTYSQAVEALESALPTLSPQESAGIWGQNATRFYNLMSTEPNKRGVER